MTSGTLYTLLGITVITGAIIGAGWRLAAKITRLIDEVAANTRMARRLGRRTGKLAGRMERVEQRVDTLERR